MHKKLEDQKKELKIDKETREEILQSKRLQINLLTFRLNATENSPGDTQVSNVLKQYHEVQEKVRSLIVQNNELNEKLEKNSKQWKLLKLIKLSEIRKSLKDLINYMDTMTQYIYGLEEEKRLLKRLNV